MEDVTSNPVDAGQEKVVESQAVEQVSQELPDSSVTPETAEPERVKQTPEENAMFAKVRREAEERARVKAEDDVIARLYGESHGIKTMAEYNAAVQAQQEAERIADLQERGIEPDFLKTLIESDPDVKEARRLKTETKNRQDFLNYFKSENGREYDPSKDIIPDEVWELTFTGVPLKDAYAMNETKMMRAELNRLKSLEKAQETNTRNSDSSPGGVNGFGSVDDSTISEEWLERASQSEIMKRWNDVSKFLSKKK